MKRITFIFIVLAMGCNPESSPEGRSKIRDKELKEDIYLLKKQN